MSTFIKHPLYLGHQTFRLSRGKAVKDNKGNRTFVPHPDYWETADCRRVGCDHYRLGWVTTVDMNTDLGKRQAEYIRKRSGKAFREEDGGGGLVRFVFTEGQKCFRDHQAPVDREPAFLHIIPRRGPVLMEGNRFLDTWKEVLVRQRQHRREI